MSLSPRLGYKFVFSTVVVFVALTSAREAAADPAAATEPLGAEIALRADAGFGAGGVAP